MKQLMTIAKKSAFNSDGFLNGLIKGAIGSAAVLVVLTFMTGYTV